MPPKRKSLPAEVDDKSRKAKVVKKTEVKIRNDVESTAKLESEYKEPIKYDEYMEGGIPSSLLEGLGFSEAEVQQEPNPPDDDDESGDVAAPETVAVPGPLHNNVAAVFGSQALTSAMSSFVVDQINAMAKSGMISGLLPQQILNLTAAAGSKLGSLSTQAIDQSKKTVSPSVTPQRSSRRLTARNSTPAETITVDSSRSVPSKNLALAQNVRPAVSKPVQPFPTAPGSIRQPVASASQPQKVIPKTPRVYNSTPRTVTKGNIVYERMPTGEVIASLIKKPAADGVGRTNPGVVIDSVVRGSQSAQRTTQANNFAPISLENCPINEFNVGEVLEKSIKATQSMRMLLTSLRDDLRRIGAGSAMVTEEQVRKRQEVADKLTKAYTTYKRSIEDIESPQSVDGARIAAAAAAAASGVITQRGEKPSEAMPHSTMQAKLAATGGINEQSKQWRNSKPNSTANRGKFGQDKEVIELSESDDEDHKKNLPVLKEERGNDIRKRQSLQADASNASRAETVPSDEPRARLANKIFKQGNKKNESGENSQMDVDAAEADAVLDLKDCNGCEGEK